MPGEPTRSPGNRDAADSDGGTGPPRALVALLRFLLPPRARGHVIDDMVEEYRRLLVPELGRRRADARFRKHVLESVLPAVRWRFGAIPAWSLIMLTLLTDLRQARRRLSSSPAFSAAAVLTLALGIGATTGIFTLVYSVLLRPLPYGDPDRLVTLQHATPGLGVAVADVSEAAYLHYRRHAETLDSLAMYQEASVNLTGDGEAERVALVLATPGFFETLQVLPALGRSILPEDNEPGRDPIVLISHELWQTRYGGDPAIVGREIEINRRPREVVGVMPAGFDFPSRDTRVWMNLGVDPAPRTYADFWYLGIARLANGVTVAQAEAELDALIPGLAELVDDATPEALRDGGISTILEPLAERTVGDVRGSLWLLFVTVAGVLVIACANVANLFLVRGEHRHQEIALRTALGAGRGAVVRFFLAESSLLAGAGGLVGLGCAALAIRVLAAGGRLGLPRQHEIDVDPLVVGFAVALTALISLLLGLVPAARHGAPEVAATLRDGTRGATSGRARRRARSALVALQVALALVLMVGSTLMLRSTLRLMAVDPGFDARGVLTLQITLPYRGYPEYARTKQFYDLLLEGIRAIPEVERAGAASDAPMVARLFSTTTPIGLIADGAAVREADVAPTGEFTFVTEGFFETMGMRLRAGAWPQRGSEGERPVLLSDALARRLFADGVAVGRRARTPDADGDWMTVVGVVEDVRRETVQSSPAEIVYLPTLEALSADGWNPGHMVIAIKSDASPDALVAAIRALVAELDPAVPISDVRSMESALAESMARERLTTVLLTIAAVAALLLGAVGLYGVVAYTVSQRQREIGVRMVLGAAAADVRGMVLQQGTRVVLVGLGLGVVAALVATRYLDSLLFEVSPTDPATFVVVSLGLVAVALLATWLPARRAARIDPVRALAAD